MQKIVAKRVYDTDTAVLLKKKTGGTFGDPCGWEESLYRTKDGFYFLYMNGGKDSRYPEEAIRRLSEGGAASFMKSEG